MNSSYLYLAIFTLVPFYLGAQVSIFNASFEGVPRDAAALEGWEACSYSSTPDILPGPWGVNNTPVEGKTFLGLITRIDKTWEYIGQLLEQPLIKNQCYTFSTSLSRSDTYADFNQPVKLRIWAGNELCDNQQLLGESAPVYHEEWKRYEFVFIPKENYRFFAIEAYYLVGPNKAYNGNVLVDNCSMFEICNRVDLDIGADFDACK